MGALRRVIPAHDGVNRLPFESAFGIFHWKPELSPSASNGAKCAVTAREDRPNRNRNVEPATSECAFAPLPFIGDQLAGANEYGDRGANVFRPPQRMPDRERPCSQRLDCGSAGIEVEYVDRQPLLTIDDWASVEGHVRCSCRGGGCYIIAGQVCPRH